MKGMQAGPGGQFGAHFVAVVSPQAAVARVSISRMRIS